MKNNTEVLDYAIDQLIESTKRINEDGKSGHNLQMEFQKAKHTKENMKVMVEAVKTKLFERKLLFDMGNDTKRLGN